MQPTKFGSEHVREQHGATSVDRESPHFLVQPAKLTERKIKKDVWWTIVAVGLIMLVGTITVVQGGHPPSYT